VCNLIREAITAAVGGTDLTQGMAEAVMEEIMGGQATPAQIAGFLVSMRLKGETAEEITAFARIMRARSRQVNPRVKGRIVDTCGTGGDGLGTFNISTTAMFIAAGAGVTVAKHGNRSVSSSCGSADVLEYLGARLELEPREVERMLEATGACFMFAPAFHPAMKHALGPRRELGVRTFFNILGPLTNPCRAEGHLMGVYSAFLIEKIALAALNLGLKRAFIVHGEDGQDEISTTGVTRVCEVSGGGVNTYSMTPRELKVSKASISDLMGGSARTNARIMLEVLSGMDTGPRRDAAIVNAAGAIAASWDSGSIADAMEPAQESLETGRALSSLVGFIEATGGQARVEEILEQAPEEIEEGGRVD
jgi:anthranilate phosphoribosyltransferase